VFAAGWSPASPASGGAGLRVAVPLAQPARPCVDCRERCDTGQGLCILVHVLLLAAHGLWFCDVPRDVCRRDSCDCEGCVCCGIRCSPQHCCDIGNQCSRFTGNPRAPGCCAAGRIVCRTQSGGDPCCNPPNVCTAVGCCPVRQACGPLRVTIASLADTCCRLENQECVVVGGRGVCQCPGDRPACARNGRTRCCRLDQFCDRNGECRCTSGVPCGTACCTGGQICEGTRCCPPCGPERRCCPEGTSCCQNQVCACVDQTCVNRRLAEFVCLGDGPCPLARQCGAVCCGEQEVCNPTTQQCESCGPDTVVAATQCPALGVPLRLCCPPGAVNCNGSCCPLDQTCCCGGRPFCGAPGECPSG
jgi:hypothetical protein